MRSRFPFWIVLVLAIAVRVSLIDRPFLPNLEATATGIPAIHALNFARYGPVSSRFAGVLNTGLVPRENWTLYAHHPPLVPLGIAAAYRVAGLSNWSTRLVPAVFSIATTVLLFTIASRRFGARTGFIAGIFYLGAPATVAFGGIPDYINGQLAFFMLATVAAYFRWRETGRAQWMWLTALLFAAGALTDWPAFYLAPILVVHYWLTAGRRFLPTLRLAAVPALLLIAIVGWMESIDGPGAFLEQFVVRMSGHGTTWPLWLRGVLVDNVTGLHTLPVVLLTFVYLGFLMTRVRASDGRERQRHHLPMVLLLGGALHLLIGRTGNMQPWWAVVVTAPLALAAALGLDMLARALSRTASGATTIVAATVAVFAMVAIPSAIANVRFEWPHTREAGYRPGDLGAVIHAVAAPDEGVLTSDYLEDPTLWFYADRQIRPQIVDVSLIDDALGEGPYTLPYGYDQRNGPRPRWFVLPPPHRLQLAKLVAVLDARFPRRDIDGYAVYELRDRFDDATR